MSTMVQRESTQEAVAIFRTEIMQVLREIQTEYEHRLEAARSDIQAAYEMKIHALKSISNGVISCDGPVQLQLKDENTKLRQLVVDQRRKLRVLEENVRIS